MTALPVLRLLTLAVVAASAGAARAASFDCTKAKTPNERTICTSPRLSTLDEQLARDYERALQALSPEGAALQKAAQRRWLRFVARACGALQGGKPATPGDRAECLQRELGRRIDQLAMAGVRVGPWVVNRVDLYEAAPSRSDDDSGMYPGVVATHVAYVQIDAPRTPATLAWNAKHAKTLAPADTGVPEADAQPEDDDDELTIGCAGERFVSLDVTTLTYPHGAAHGSTAHAVDNMLLLPVPRAMTAADIFAPGADWRGRLPTLFWQAYLADKDADKDNQDFRKGIHEAAATPARWLLTPQGLQLAFDSDELGCHACNAGPLTVPWSALKPMLAAPDLAACKAPAR